MNNNLAKAASRRIIIDGLKKFLQKIFVFIMSVERSMLWMRSFSISHCFPHSLPNSLTLTFIILNFAFQAIGSQV